MHDYKERFIDFLVASQVLTFGDFVTKSGRRTPFFVNSGRYRTGAQLEQLGRFYAEALVARLGDGFDVLFGPAYKGIPLVAATAMTLSAHYGRDVAYCFNRKEAKDHGEGGVLVGESLSAGQRVVIVEDVTTAGTSVHETVPLLRAAAPITLAGLVVSVDRAERGKTEQSALSELSATYAMPAFAIVTIDEVVESLRTRPRPGVPPLDDELYERILAYRREYGAKV